LARRVRALGAGMDVAVPVDGRGGPPRRPPGPEGQRGDVRRPATAQPDLREPAVLGLPGPARRLRGASAGHVRPGPAAAVTPSACTPLNVEAVLLAVVRPVVELRRFEALVPAAAGLRLHLVQQPL